MRSFRGATLRTGMMSRSRIYSRVKE